MDKKICKRSIVQEIQRQSSLTATQAGRAVSAVIESIQEALQAGRTVELEGLGVFSTQATAARTAVRIPTGETVVVPGGRKIRFQDTWSEGMS